MFSRSKEELKLITACGPSSKVTTQMGDDQIEIVFTTILDGIEYGVATNLEVEDLGKELECMHKDMAGLIRK
tara:strand:- start:431 stop:646 length:216 start_codon:yes stop_codon:yes gene_type:complete